MKKVSILQSNYIAWKGYFDIIQKVDEFILYDDVQYTRSDWRNRNKIKTPNGPTWLTIPVGKHYNRIDETIISDSGWGKKHWSTLVNAYKATPYFKDYKDIFENFYLNTNEKYLSLVNYELITIINKIMGINTKITWSTDYKLIEGKSARLADLVMQAGGTEYLTGPSAKSYLEVYLFTDNGIKVSWMDYSGYPEYHQLHPPFEHAVTVLDLIFNEGPNAMNMINDRQQEPEAILTSK